jgi:hypothetical protein
VNSNGTGVVYAGYIGGDEPDIAKGISVDLTGNVYITGETQSTESSFPVITGPDLEYNGGLRMLLFQSKCYRNRAGYVCYIGGEA